MDVMEQLRNQPKQAFPIVAKTDEGIYIIPGMDLRDWFAGQALAVMANRSTYCHHHYANEAYAVADAMMEARKKEAKE